MGKSQQEIAAPESQNENGLGLNSGKQGNYERSKFFTTKRITLLAALIAFSLIMKLIGKALTITPAITITFVYIPWLLAGVILGPLSGMIVSALSDILGNLVFGVALNPLTLLSNTLFSLPIALIYKTKLKNDYLKVVLGSLISLIVCTMGIGSFALYWSRYLIGTDQPINYFLWFITNRAWQPLIFAVNLVVLCLMIKPLQKVGIFPISDDIETSSGGKTFFSISAIIITAIMVTFAVLAAVYEKGYAMTYVVLAAIYLGLLALCSLSLRKSSVSYRFISPVISIAISLLCIAVAIILPNTRYNAFTFVPNNLMYMLIALPLFAGALSAISLRKGITSKDKPLVLTDIAGIVLALAAITALIIGIVITITANGNLQ